MATSWRIEVGYNSGDSCDIDREEMWDRLKAAALDICEHPERIVEEARRFNAPEECDEGCCTLENHSERYKERSDLAIKFIEGDQLEEDQEPYIFQMASGDRELKEHIRRAFCRLVIYEMHKLGIEVNLIVG